MKYSYKVLNDGTVDVIDYSREGEKRNYVYEYQDNLEDIFKQQEVASFLELKRQIISQEIEKNNISINRNKKTNKLWLISVVVLEIVFTYAFSLLKPGLNVLSFVPFIFGTIMSVPVLSSSFLGISKFKKQNRGYKLEIEELEKELKKSYNKINDLLEEKTKDNYESQKIKDEYIKINSTEELKKISDYLHNYYIIGYNEKEFYNCYKNGILEKQLGDDFDYMECDTPVVMKYFEEKGHVLAKKYDKR